MGFFTPFIDITWVLALRTDTLTVFFSYMPVLMQATFIFGVIGILFWLSPIRGFVDLAVTSGFSYVYTNLLKVIFAQSRPPLEFQLVHVDSQLGMPSGDAIFGVFFWMSIATLVSHRIVKVLSYIIILLILISRVYLGVHTPLQVVAGVAFGLILYLLHFSKPVQNVYELWFERGKVHFYWLTLVVILALIVLLRPSVLDLKVSMIIISSLVGLGLAATLGIVCRGGDGFNIGRVAWGLLLSGTMYWLASMTPDYDIEVLSAKINLTDFMKYTLLTLNLYWLTPQTYNLFSNAKG